MLSSIRWSFALATILKAASASTLVTQTVKLAGWIQIDTSRAPEIGHSVDFMHVLDFLLLWIQPWTLHYRVQHGFPLSKREALTRVLDHRWLSISVKRPILVIDLIGSNWLRHRLYSREILRLRRPLTIFPFPRRRRRKLIVIATILLLIPKQQYRLARFHGLDWLKLIIWHLGIPTFQCDFTITFGWCSKYVTVFLNL